MKSAADLPKFKDKFKDPENLVKAVSTVARPLGMRGHEYQSVSCAQARRQLHAVFAWHRRGQKAALMSAYKRKQDVVFYYWFPTPLVGAMDLVKLKCPL
ncbi:substrate binding domain of ABC-type glycine betaine transport system family protein [Bordetella holmesii 70147]|nr:substrate binding domain of ABC-type glycine betaine transport system family protein [Bordetella holmesii 70147]